MDNRESKMDISKNLCQFFCSGVKSITSFSTVILMVRVMLEDPHHISNPVNINPLAITILIVFLMLQIIIFQKLNIPLLFHEDLNQICGKLLKIRWFISMVRMAPNSTEQTFLELVNPLALTKNGIIPPRLIIRKLMLKN